VRPKYLSVFSLIMICLLVSVLSTGTSKATIGNLIYPPLSNPLGIPYKDWGIKFFQWWLSIPKEIHPFSDPSRVNCFMGMGESVVFFPDPIISDLNKPTPINYDCTIPSDRNIFLPGMLEFCNYDKTLKTDEDLQACAHKRNPFAHHDIFIDGQKVENIKQFSFTTNYFNITYPKDNPFDYPPGKSRALLDGTWLMIKPLPPGDHVIEEKISQKMPLPQDQALNKFPSMKYLLHVVNWH
jgi:hypothetical protein